MIYKKYAAYLLSPEWKVITKRILIRDCYRCRQCGSSHSLNVHHLTYEHIYHELDIELITQCDRCHKQKHGIEEVSDSDRLDNVIEQLRKDLLG